MRICDDNVRALGYLLVMLEFRFHAELKSRSCWHNIVNLLHLSHIYDTSERAGSELTLR